jgi:small conductance mechanosensitive channel
MTWEWPQTPVTVLGILGVAVLAHVIVTWLIRRTAKRMRTVAAQPEGTLAHRAASALGTAAGAKPGRKLVHMTALVHLLRSVWTFVLFIVVLLLMQVLGVSYTPILASAGIGGVVLAFGAQSLIKDYLSGIAMILEDQFGVGDLINVGDVTGTVESITLRITKLRDPSGLIWYIRNGEILRVGNVSQGYSTGLIDVPVAYDADVIRVTEILNEVVTKLSDDPAVAGQLLEPPRLLGVESITATTLTMRILIKTPPNQQFALAREVREQAMAALSAAGIPAPTLLPYAAD